MTPKFACPCCGFLTLDEKPPGTFHICAVCYWEDDNVQFDDVHYKGGANTIDLHAARSNFLKLGASEADFVHRVRKPREDELPPKEITPDELVEIQARCDRATRGPWISMIEGRDHTSGSSFIMTGPEGDRGPDIDLIVSASDQDFIAHARQDVPRLVEEVFRLRSKLGDL